MINLWSRPHEALGKWAAEGAHRLRQFCYPRCVSSTEGACRKSDAWRAPLPRRGPPCQPRGTRASVKASLRTS